MRALIAAQQRSIEELRTAVDSLSAEAKASADADASHHALGDDLFELAERTSRLDQIVGDTRLGGWLDFVYGDSNRGGQDPWFDVNHFYLYFDMRIDEHWQALAELEFEHAPHFEGAEGRGRLQLDRAYIQYNHSQRLHSRLGKFRTPWGYWSPIHWAILVDTIQEPIHEDNQYVPNKQVGVQLFGDLFDGFLGGTSVSVEYSSWVSNGSEWFATNKPRDGKFGYGVDLRGTFAERLLLGISSYLQHNPDQSDRRELSFMAYADLQLPCQLVFRSEFMHQSRDEGFSNVWAGYAKLRWDFREDAYLNYRFDIGDDDKLAAGNRRIQNVVTLGYSPIANVRFKAEWARNTFRKGVAEDYDFWGLFVGIFF